MRLKRIIILAAGFLLSTSSLRAQNHVWSDPSGWWGSHFAYDANVPRYSGQELSLDLFGSYIAAEGKFSDLFETDVGHGFWGGGAGLNYFFTPILGLGVDFNISAKEELRLVDDVVGNLFLRLPLGNSGLAPYIFGSGGRGISPIYQWVYGGGVGLEYRWSPTTGIFSDARFLFGDEGTVYNRLLIRAGVRIVF